MKSLKTFLLCVVLFHCVVKVTSAECEDDEECVSDKSCKNYRELSKNGKKVCSIYNKPKVCCHISNITVIHPVTEMPLTASSAPNRNPGVRGGRLLVDPSLSFEKCSPKEHENINLINAKMCGISKSVDRIVNGNDTVPDEFPWLGLMKFRSKSDESYEAFMCSGSLISSRYVLTAAHCFQSDYELIFVRFGEYNITDSSGTEILDLLVEETIIHKDYDPKAKLNDIALIRLAEEVVIVKGKQNVKTICLPVDETQDIDQLTGEDHKITIAGWGRTENTGSYGSNILMKAVIDYKPNDECSEIYESLQGNSIATKISIQDTHMCAGGNENVDTCKGDSGGPIQSCILKEKGKPRWFQHGIISFGVDCSRVIPVPGVYTRVSKFMCWILDNMKN